MDDHGLPWEPHWFPSFNEYISFLKMMRKGDHDLIVIVLSHIQRVACALSPTAYQGSGELNFVGPTLLGMLEAAAAFEPTIRANALAVLNVFLTVASNGPFQVRGNRLATER